MYFVSEKSHPHKTDDGRPYPLGLKFWLGVIGIGILLFIGTAIEGVSP